MRALVAVGVVALGGLVTFRCLPRKSRQRLTAAMERWVTQHMARMMASLPENAPPKLVVSILPRLRAQNDQIIALLQEQNKLLREQRISQ